MISTSKVTSCPTVIVDELVQDRIRERYGDRITFMKTLQAQGMTFEQFRKDVRDQYIESQHALQKRFAGNRHLALQN